MSYKSALPGTFAVPEALVDEHLKLAKETHLKVLLWILRHGEAEGLEALAHWLGRPEGDLVDAVQFWIDRGLIEINDENLTTIVKTQKAAAPPVELPLVRPLPTQVLARTDEDPDLRRLFQEADRLLGRTIGYEGQCTLLMLHDTYGLPYDVIYMLLAHCAKTEKTNVTHILKVGAAWAENEIDTIEKAGEWITYLENSTSLWSQLCHHAGKDIPKGPKRKKFLLRWSGELGFGMDMICLAYDIMADRCSGIVFEFIDEVLERWHAAGIKTPAQAKAETEQYRVKKPEKPASRKEKQGSAGYAPSFDLDAFERSTLQVPVFENNA